MKLFTLLYYSPLACLELWVDLQPIRDFYHSCIVCLQNVGCELCGSSKCCHLSFYSIEKSDSLISPQISSEKYVRFEAVKLMVMGTEFSNIWIYPWKLKFYYCNNYYHLFSLKWQAHIVYFWENIFQTPKSKQLYFVHCSFK